MKIRKYKTKMSCLGLCGCETQSLTWRLLSGECKRKDATEEYKKIYIYYKELHGL